MGKKHNIVSQDPILTKHFKYEKRIKDKAELRKKKEEQNKQKNKRKQQLITIRKQVDQQLSHMMQIPLMSNNNYVESIRTVFKPKQTLQSNNHKKLIIEQLLENNDEMQTNHYQDYPSFIKTCKPISDKKCIKIAQSINQEIQAMFQSQVKMQVEKQSSTQSQILVIEHKKQQIVEINEITHKVSELLLKNESLLKMKSDIMIYQAVIRSYFDYVHIENKQESTIPSFRKIVIDHCLRHLQKCVQQDANGFTRGKILILTAFMGDAKAIIEEIEESLDNYKCTRKQKVQAIEDQNDFLRIGINIVRTKKQIKYFCNFDNSDIIIASPIGLKTILVMDGEISSSFLSSIQIMYIDRASTILMQNWQHLIEVISHINIMPNYQSLRNDINTIRKIHINLKGKVYRQNIVFSEFNFPQLNALKVNQFHNWQGIATNVPFYKAIQFSQALPQQHFYQINVKQPKDDLNTRFQYFKRKFWDNLHNNQSITNAIIFVNSYFEFIKLKLFLANTNASAECICQHTTKAKVQSRIARFINGQFRILLLTERAYYYSICEIRNFQHIWFYSLPINSYIYQESLSSMKKEQQSQIVCIYSKFDTMMIERLVGSKRSRQMVQQHHYNISFIL